MKKFDYEDCLSMLFAMNSKVELVLDVDHMTTPHTKLVYVYNAVNQPLGETIISKRLHSLGAGKSWEEALKNITFEWSLSEEHKKYWKKE